MNKTRSLVLGLVAVFTVVLYAPFFSNPLVFDDHNLFAGGRVFDHAQNVFDFYARTFPYFTIGFIQLIFDSIEVQRAFNLMLHLANVFVLIALCSRVSRVDLSAPPSAAVWGAIAACAVFAVHPVAVYGVAYLVQRTVLFASLFSLLSLLVYWRAIEDGRYRDVVVSALFYAMAVFSKEHAILLPAVACALGIAARRPGVLPRTLLYLALCALPALRVFLSLKGLVGAVAEPGAQEVAIDLLADASAGKAASSWSISALAQAGFFFRYWYLWIVPDTGAMSIDLRAYISGGSPGLTDVFKLVAFVACGLLGAALVFVSRRWKLAGVGILYFWISFLVEFSSVRFQEPFVLYRSYLWAPGFVMVLASLLRLLPVKGLVVLTVLACGVLFYLSEDRLQSMESEWSAWDDAARKLPAADVRGADRIFFNRGLQSIKAGRIAEGVADLDRVIALSPGVRQAYEQRAEAYVRLGRYPEAVADFSHAIDLHEVGASFYGRGLSFERMGCLIAAGRDYERARTLGVLFAKMKLDELEEKRMEKGQASESEACPLR